MHPTYTRTHPFLATLTERYTLTGESSTKLTKHLVLSIRGSGIEYKTGDSIGIYALNDASVVDSVIATLGATGEEEVTSKTGESWIFRHYLTSKANLHMCNRSLLQEIAKRQTDLTKRQQLDEMLLPENREATKAYLEERHVWDLLEEHREARLTPQELTGLLMPLLPRFYSIASSMLAVGEEVHLTVALTQYETNGQPRVGVASHYLCHIAPLHEPIIPIYLQPSKDFTLPEDDNASIIMVGPGTGIAPYRGFLQERLVKDSKGHNWLFFGERNRRTDFFYEEYWSELVSRGKLRLDVAFSRDQGQKVYVQHRLLEKGAEIYRWLSQGAYFYVCGDAAEMAKAVDEALLAIVQEHGGKTLVEASDYVKTLRKNKRYLRDVY